MKVIMSIATLVFLCLNLNAQNVESLFEKYAEIESATKIVINKNILKLMTDDEKDYEALKEINGIEMIVLDEQDNLPIKEYKTLLGKVQKLDLEELVTIRSEDTYVNFMFDEEGKYLKNLIMIGRTDESTFMFRLDGRILRSHLDELDINLQGMNHLKGLGKI